ncbi:MAG: hypothetical protein HN352_11815 [Bacteroidetes bacterium]|jgi:uncharacterized protein (TIGR02145 family)|nr:hypothetical protein [Bacteroidota bacterium]MBT3750169.1 hypothetical protein [Bacteroidota bacterium]MBT4399624.1 hypothetical protein [Bacteroidota bacterium]MBT4409742.1 hypothetical protein [Bacteroidota bacterium]MBT7093922.1 hypothetical protein [Bacteroidota bacterium]
MVIKPYTTIKQLAIILLLLLSSYISKSQEEGTFIDERDSTEYKWIMIGDQVWTAQNLTYLPSISCPEDGSRHEPFYYVYDYKGITVSKAKATSKYDKYGILYNWVASKTACPKGWHLPCDEEWKILELHLGMSPAFVEDEYWRESGGVGKKIKSTSTWAGGGIGDNSSGFNALRSGTRYFNGFFQVYGYNTEFWTSTPVG